MRARAIAGLLATVLIALTPTTAQARQTVVESFDGTPIVTNFFPGKGVTAGKRAPTILVGPGWSISGATDPDSEDGGVAENFGLVPIGTFVKDGYNVVTWDPRGFGGSGGTVQVDDPDFEGRDVQAILDYIATQPEAELDSKRRRDPVAGMAGGSYGGGIQLVTAGIDRRIDAIIPTIAWNSLVTSLFQDGAVKSGWGAVLIAAGVQGATLPGLGSPAGPQTGHHDPHFYSTVTNGSATGQVPPDDVAWFADNGPDFLLPKVKIPTLIIQGTVDTLFPLDEAARTFRALNNNTRRRGERNARTKLPVKMIFFCGGHGACFTGDAPDGYVEKRSLAWFDRYLRGNRDNNTGPRFAWVAEDGKLRNSRRFPGSKAGTLSGAGSGVLALTEGASGGGGVLFATPSGVAVNVEIPGPEQEALPLGAPKLKLTYSGVAAPEQTFAYAQIVNPRNNTVVGNMATPVPLTLDGAERSVRMKMEWVVGSAPAGGGYTLQLAPSSSVWDLQRSNGAVEFSRVEVSIPLREPVAGKRR